MIASRHLYNAPIHEAIIDIQVMLDEAVTIEELEKSYSEFSSGYPTKKIINHDTVGLLMGGSNPKTTVDRATIGYRFESEDGKNVVQFRTNGFTFSRLKRYETWEDMRDEAYRLWGYYAKVANPIMISRMATRFINALELPLPIKQYEDYLTAPPTIPSTLSLDISSFISRVVVPNDEIEATGIITLGMESLQEEYAPVFLDIDVFIENDQNIDEKHCWECLEKLRVFKNKIFFESITEKTAEIYQ